MARSLIQTVRMERLPFILEELRTRSIAIPPFRRDFEWSKEQRLSLCRSLFLGLPMGSLLVWKTSRVLPSDDIIGPYRIEPPEHEIGHYLIDGYQRMSALFAALGAGLWRQRGVGEIDRSSHAAPDGSPWPIFFNLDSDDFELGPKPAHEDDRQLTLSGLDAGSTSLPLSALFDPTAFSSWLHESSLPTRFVNKARALQSTLSDYSIPLLTLATDDMGLVTLTIQQINRGGTPMSDAHMARALAWRPDFDLRDHIDGVRERLRAFGWGDIEDDLILKVVALVCEIDPMIVNAEPLARKIKDRPQALDEAGKRLEDAVDLLKKTTGIRGPGALPYSQILLFAARALHHTGAALTLYQEGALCGWIVDACMDERFGGMSSSAIQGEWRALADNIDVSNAGGAESRKTRVARECRRFSMAWARSRTTALVLAGNAPRDGRGALIVDPLSLIAHRHEAVGMFVVKGMSSALRASPVALRSPANRMVCPPELMPGLRTKLFQRDCPVEILQSHLIDKEAHEALCAHDLETFFERRRAAILDAERRWVEARGGTVDLQLDPRLYAQG